MFRSRSIVTRFVDVVVIASISIWSISFSSFSTIVVYCTLAINDVDAYDDFIDIASADDTGMMKEGRWNNSSDGDSDNNDGDYNISTIVDDDDDDDDNDNEQQSIEDYSSSSTLVAAAAATAAASQENPIIMDVNNNQTKEDMKEPLRVLKVYILAGQSNMVGAASIEHLKELIFNNSNDNDDDHNNTNNNNNSSNDNYYNHLWNETTGEWIMNSNVFCQFNKREGGLLQVNDGTITRSNSNSSSNRDRDRDNSHASENSCSRIEEDDNKYSKYQFGPEVGFGWQMMSSTSSSSSSNSSSRSKNDETEIDKRPSPHVVPILILKQAWDSSDLAVDFRPPSSGKGNYEYSHQYEGMYYNAMLDNLKLMIHSLQSNIIATTTTTKNNSDDTNNNDGSGYLQKAIHMKNPNKNNNNHYHDAYYWPSSGNERIEYDSFEISGFVWFQGWNDFTEDEMCDEYELNLANFVRDIRHDLNTVTSSQSHNILPFVIGELGQHGPINSNSTTDTDDDYISSIFHRIHTIRQSQYNITQNYPEFENNTMFVETAKYFQYHVSESEADQYDQIEHYYGRADIIYKIGEDFGKAMIQLERNREKRERERETERKRGEVELSK